MSEVDSIIWPNPEFDNNITVYGPEVMTAYQYYWQNRLAEFRVPSSGLVDRYYWIQAPLWLGEEGVPAPVLSGAIRAAKAAGITPQ